MRKSRPFVAPPVKKDFYVTVEFSTERCVIVSAVSAQEAERKAEVGEGRLDQETSGKMSVVSCEPY